MKIHTDLPIEVLVAMAQACGFHLSFDHSPGADEWILSAGHGQAQVTHAGTREAICAFLTGYAAMRIQTTQILNDLDRSQKQLIADIRDRL